MRAGAMAVLGLATLLGACQPAPAPVPVPLSRVTRPPVVFDTPGTPLQRHAARRHEHGPCETADATGLTDAQKSALFEQFDAWQNPGTKGAAESATSETHRSVTPACRSPTR